MKKQIFYEVRVEDNVDGEIIFNTYDFKTIGAAKNKMDEEKEVKSKWKDNCSKEDLYIEEEENSFFMQSEVDDYYTKIDILEKTFED